VTTETGGVVQLSGPDRTASTLTELVDDATGIAQQAW